MRKTVLVSVVVGLVAIAVAALALRLVMRTDGRTVVVDTSSYSVYPAALVSLNDGVVTPMPINIRDIEVTADLLIEPRVPRIVALRSTPDRVTGDGPAARILLLDSAYEEVDETAIPAGWTTEPKGSERFGEALWKHRVGVDIVFLVRSRHGPVYKVRIDDLDRDDGYMALTYEELTNDR